MLWRKPSNSRSADPGILLPDESIYGIRKKASFLAGQVVSLRERLGRPPRVLDFGCGNAETIGRTLISTGCEYWGVDMHEPSLIHARRQFSTTLATFCSEPPDDVAFDVIVYGDVIEHMDNPVSILSHHRNLLVPDGMIMGAVPNGFGPFEIENWLNRKLRLRKIYDRFEEVYYAIRHVIAKWVKTRILGRTLPPPEEQAQALPFNFDSGHVQFFSLGKFTETLVSSGYQPEVLVNASFIGGQLTGQMLRNYPGFNDFNVGIADRLPHWMVSGWIFTAGKT